MENSPSVLQSATSAQAHWRIEVKNYLARKGERVLSTPWITRPILNLLREWRPITLVRGYALVTKYRDVRAVFADDKHFASDYLNAGPNQIVAMPDTSDYHRLKEIMTSGLGSDFQTRLRTIVENSAGAIFQNHSKRFDAVSAYARVIAVDLTNCYLGIPADRNDMERWTRTIFRNIFANMSDDAKMIADASDSLRELNACIDKLIAKANYACASGGSTPDNFFGRLLTSDKRNGAPDSTIRDLMVGLVTALVDNVSNMIARSMKYLLDHPEQGQGAAKAAHDGDADRLFNYILEALRFNPENPLLIRLCSNAATLGSMTSRETIIPAGTHVLAATEGAMFDAEAFPDPGVFQSDRPRESYLHFGWGRHHCFGHEIARVVLPAAVGALLKLPNLKRVRGWQGRVIYDGAFVEHMLVEYE